mmetsp:Transcript_1110/g.2344  ORF Transcript_1110/g.2344 Transcript_1110/m.2344 type:complete len:223 (+) Transcript_1110:1369-2037(+)
MIRGLVQQQYVRLLAQDLPQPDPHLPPPGKHAHEVVPLVLGEAHEVHDLPRSGFERVHALGLGLPLQVLHPVQHLLHPVRIAAVHPLQFLLRLLQVHQDPVLLLEDAHEFLHQRPIQYQFVHELLPQHRDPQVLGALDHVPGRGFQLPAQDSELSGLPGAVGPHESDSISGLNAPGDVLEDLLIAEGDADVLEAEGGEAGLGGFHDADAGGGTFLADLFFEG